DDSAVVSIGTRIKLRNPCGNRLDLAFGLLPRDARLKPADNSKIPHVSTARVGLAARELNGHPQLRVTARKLKAFRHHSHDLARLVVDANDLADNVWISPKPALPQPIAQNSYGRLSG